MDQAVSHHTQDRVRIHIDREPYESPNPTNGMALYDLGCVPAHHDLFREVGGDREDELVERDVRAIQLQPEQHFYSQRAYTIIVNTEEKEVANNRLSFDDVVKLAFEPVPTGPNVLITIDFGMGPPQNPKGSLKKGETVRIKNGMIFDVTATDRS